MLRTVLIRSALKHLQSTSTLCTVTRINFQFRLEMRKQEEEAERPDKSLLTGETISIIVGEEKKTWILHQRLLAFHSSFFAARPEVEDDKLKYPNDDPAAWSLLVKYLYQGSLPLISKSCSAIQKYEHAVTCHKLYNLGLRFSISRLVNLAMDHFRESLRSAHLVPDPEELTEMYLASPAGSRMRKLLIRIAARQIMDPEKERDVTDYQTLLEREVTFAVDLITEIRRQTGGMLLGDPNAGEGPDYREEIGGEEAICGNGEKRVRFR